MNSIGKRVVLILVALAMGLSGAFAQGMYWESTVTGEKMDGSDVMKTWYMPKMLKLQTRQDGDYSVLRLDQEKMYMIKPGNKTYSVMTFAEMEEGMKKTNAQMDKALEQMKDMPAEQREMMEKMLGKSAGKQKEKATLKKSTETKKIGGYTCAHYTILRGKDEVADLWVTKEIRGFDRMRNDLKSFSRRMTAMNPTMGGDLARVMEDIDGFPIEQSMAGIKSVITKLEPKVTSLSEFEVPAGFKKVDMKQMGKGVE